ncbi:Teneurin-1 and related extracellular matrix proteins, contain EGF-like repeats [Plasmopara halstedii]|uniref:Teneurin-1 and related extracellular matrix proteins, contain EGF-like repeats n=1 Tax=Plasmopara halstedii TaxID=4781 RepID=A0A0N7L8E6_PLAHL|nr:Teneurin-1 and related extracellular matrix proteins, contain EGF-like repeats [Plasmopara halstedii]CEG49659.1 Teneurin-1 and related extracellular matrix proteins, contain EGF-like repeats [Plasmopara halstedii]|eukprot:XP_024586028.1 Teneurin-1 and related extracellular matrix proteins, contain EGF-like repeats [Plasmopara halstedii]
MWMSADVTAYCPNGCNAQGTCGKNDKCTCYERQDQETPSIKYPAYKGADCSLRTCPYGDAWVQVPTAANTAHSLTECSNQGNCDYVTGHCMCFPGYGGKACERAECPNDCNSRGICLTLAAIIAGSPNVLAAYTAWDANKHMGCYCDQGYRGPDCSLKECPSGDDVLLAFGQSQGRDCGGRGKCNYESGECECFPGYYGTACDSQTTVN